MPYEQGMQIDYDADSKQAYVSFRGERVRLLGKYETLEAAKRAGEDYCHAHGWKT